MLINNSILLEKIEEIRKINKPAYFKLKKWYEEIKDYEKLRFNDVKILNKLMLESTGSKKEEIRERLIFGTLHFVYNFVLESGLTAFSTSLFDLDDIMNSSIEIWINMLDEGVLVKGSNRPIQTLHRSFYNRIIYNLVKGNNKDEFDESDDDKKRAIKSEIGIYGVDNRVMVMILEEFIFLLSLGYIIGENIFYDCVATILKESGTLNKVNNLSKRKLIVSVYDVCIFVIKSLNIKDISRLSKTELEYLFNTFILVYKYNDLFEIEIGDFIYEYEKSNLLIQFREYLFNTRNLNDNQRGILISCFGLEDSICKTQKELADVRERTYQTIGNSYRRGLYKLKGDKIIQNIREEMKR